MDQNDPREEVEIAEPWVRAKRNHNRAKYLNDYVTTKKRVGPKSKRKDLDDESLVVARDESHNYHVLCTCFPFCFNKSIYCTCMIMKKAMN